VQAPPPTIKRARRFRKEMTLPEVLLWKQLRGRLLDGLYFRRQHPVGPYVLDFYCEEFRLAVEVDGSAHFLPGRQEHDAERDAWMALRKIRTLRIPATSVLKHMHETLDYILHVARSDLKNPLP
jgi:very-short-patch-repair endonuclease